jgi:hypothetical protein
MLHHFDVLTTGHGPPSDGVRKTTGTAPL